MNKKKKTFLYILAVLIILSFIAFYNGLTIEKYTIKTNKISSDIRIVLIADLHSHIYGENQERLLDKIEKQHPDIIALSGDIVDDIEPFLGAKLFLERVTKIAPTYYVTGNHEYWSKDIAAIKSNIKDLGITILENESLELKINDNEIVLFGIEDPDIIKYDARFKGESWKQMLEDLWLNTDKYKILLSHRPERVESYKKYDYDLILSGHAHGGQVRIPFIINGLLAPDQGWFPKYAGGLYEYNDTKHIVSRGISYNKRLPRIFNPPEIVVIDIIGEN